MRLCANFSLMLSRRKEYNLPLASPTIGNAQGTVVKKAWAAQREFIVMAAACKKPEQSALAVRKHACIPCIFGSGGSRRADA